MDRLLELTSRAEAAHFWFHGFRAFVVPVLAQLAAGRPGLQLIDCGCGTGHNLRLLRPHGRAVGFDLKPDGQDKASQTGSPFVCGDIAHIPFASSLFDMATSFDVLQCVERDRDAVREMARVLKPGGHVVLTLAALEALRGDHAESWSEVRRYTPQTARELLEQAGLRVERVSFLFASLFPLMLAVRGVQRLMRPFRGLREDTDIAVPSAPINALLTRVVLTEAAIGRHVKMPIGSSLLVVGRKP